MAERDQNKLDKYLEEMKEVQDHQYTPGYWAGGKRPRFFRSGSDKLMKIIYPIFGLLVLAVAILYYFEVDRRLTLGLSLYILLALAFFAIGFAKVE